MKTNEILSAILSNEGLSVREFSDALGYPTSKLYDIKQGRTKKFDEDLISLISDKYPKYTREFLLTGIEDYGGARKEQDSTVLAIKELERVLGEMAAQREMSDRHMTEAFGIIKHFQEQTDRLIAMMELKNNSL